MRQVCIIHGGSTYDSDADYLLNLESSELDYARLLYRPRWNNWIGETLKDADVLLPSFPNGANAKYNEWATYFSKLVPFLSSESILVGHSLGGIFLAKYLNEHADSLHFSKVILISAPFNDETSESLASFKIQGSLHRLHVAADEFYIFHSRDDVVVPVSEVEKYANVLPSARVTLFEDRGHINTPTFPELLEILKK